MGFAAGKRGIAGPRLVGLAVVLAAILLGACDGGASARPTEPRELLATAIRTTAHLPSLRLHVEMVSDMGQLAQGMPNATMHLVYDFDVDLGGRQLAGKSTMQFPAAVAGRSSPAASAAGRRTRRSRMLSSASSMIRRTSWRSGARPRAAWGRATTSPSASMAGPCAERWARSWIPPAARRFHRSTARSSSTRRRA
jgi:hypothetical protein